MQVTIYDIAQKADVSIATVSRVLNNQPRVAPATRERVLSVAAELGYQPHSFAQSLARRQSNLISVVVPAMTSYFFLEVLRGIQDSLSESGYDIVVHLAKTSKDAEVQFERALRRGRSAGVVVVSPAILSAIRDRIERARTEVVLVDCKLDDFDSITVDNVRGGYEATRHLVELGCRQIALVMADPASPPAFDRCSGYRRALAQYEIPYSEKMVASSSGTDDGFTEDGGYRAMREILDAGERPDGVFVTSDVQALGVLRAAAEFELSTPDRLKVVGFDDIPLLRYAGITTIRQPMYRLGWLAGGRLLERLGDAQLPRLHVVEAPDLVVRGTTRVAESGDADAIPEAVTVAAMGDH